VKLPDILRAYILKTVTIEDLMREGVGAAVMRIFILSNFLSNLHFSEIAEVLAVTMVLGIVFKYLEKSTPDRSFGEPLKTWRTAGCSAGLTIARRRNHMVSEHDYIARERLYEQ
jgi:hypothetical protein